MTPGCPAASRGVTTAAASPTMSRRGFYGFATLSPASAPPFVGAEGPVVSVIASKRTPTR
jgi:hypothetical protein